MLLTQPQRSTVEVSNLVGDIRHCAGGRIVFLAIDGTESSAWVAFKQLRKPLHLLLRVKFANRFRFRAGHAQVMRRGLSLDSVLRPSRRCSRSGVSRLTWTRSHTAHGLVARKLANRVYSSPIALACASDRFIFCSVSSRS
jgi:hypothetical protein